VSRSGGEGIYAWATATPHHGPATIRLQSEDGAGINLTPAEAAMIAAVLAALGREVVDADTSVT
jgi:L-asparaginase II